MANLQKTLETMTILNVSFEGFSEEGPSTKVTPLIECPTLKHLTLSPSCSEISNFLVRCPNLTSLHLVLDNRGDVFDTGSTKGLPLHTIQPGLRSYTLSGKGQHVNTALLLQCIVPASSNIASLPLLTIRDMIVIMDINYGVHRLPGDGRFNELVFENVKYCFTDEMTLSGPSDPVELDRKWKALPRLCERADCVRLISAKDQRTMQPLDWEDEA